MILKFNENILKSFVKLFDGDLKAAVMLSVAVAKQKKFNKENEPDKFGHNFWPMTIEEWKKFGLGTDKTQKLLRQKLNQYDFYRERIWGRNRRPGKYKEGRSCPPRMEFFIDINMLEEALQAIELSDESVSL